MAFSGDYALATITNPGAALTDFSLMVDLSRMPTEWWAAVDTSDGTKGRAAKDDGTTELAVDWIDFDDTAETGWARIKWSGTLAASGTQKLRIYPPKAANSSYLATDTYGSDNAYASHWVGYWPFDGSSPLADRTSNGHDLTNNGATQSSSGKMGDAYDFEESESDYLIIADGLGLSGGGPVTAMAWVRPETITGADKTIVNISDSGASFQWTLKLALETTGAVLSASSRDGVGGSGVADTANALSAATWHFAAGDNDDGAGNVHAVLDESLANEGDTGHSHTITNPNETEVGRADEGGGRYWDGLIDDLQVHNVVLADAWREHEHEQTNDQATFWGTWTWTTVGGGLSIPIAMHHYKQMRGEAP